MPGPGRYNLTAVRADTLRRRFTWKSGATTGTATAVDLTGCSARLQVKDAVGTALITLTSPASGLTLGGTAGTIDAVFSAANNAQVPADYTWDLQVTLANGDVRTLLYGTYSILPETTT